MSQISTHLLVWAQSKVQRPWALFARLRYICAYGRTTPSQCLGTLVARQKWHKLKFNYAFKVPFFKSSGICFQVWWARNASSAILSTALHCVLIPTYAWLVNSQHLRDKCIDVLHVSIAASPCQNDHADKLHGVEHNASIGDPVNSVNAYGYVGWHSRFNTCTSEPCMQPYISR